VIEMKKAWHMALAGFMALILLAGCTPAPTTTEPTETTPPVSKQAVDLMANVQSSAWQTVNSPPDSQVVNAVNRFSMTLLRESVRNEGNILISPASVFLALAMTLNGADNETRDAMLQVLAEKDIPVEAVNQASQAWIAKLTQNGKKTSLEVANSIWFDQGFVPDPAFLQTNADYYKAGASKLDFRVPEAVGIINGWVDEATHGKIETIIEEIPAFVVMYLINTIYFVSDWQTPFLTEQTQEMDFKAPDGSVKAKFMHRTDRITAFELDAAQGIALPYDDGQFAFFALLPPEGTSPRDWLDTQSDTVLFGRLAVLLAAGETEQIDLYLPKFEVRYDNSLREELISMGMGIAFNGQADFSLMNADRAKDLFINDVKHKTYIRVDEKGTEAAAVTAVEMGKTAIPDPPRRIDFNRPFVYGIYDVQNGMPLFVGILEEPAA